VHWIGFDFIALKIHKAKLDRCIIVASKGGMVAARCGCRGLRQTFRIDRDQMINYDGQLRLKPSRNEIRSISFCKITYGSFRTATENTVRRSRIEADATQQSLGNGDLVGGDPDLGENRGG
jgi:hypothetical protein